jgi:hypothetical protein
MATRCVGTAASVITKHMQALEQKYEEPITRVVTELVLMSNRIDSKPELLKHSQRARTVVDDNDQPQPHQCHIPAPLESGDMASISHI